MTDNHIEYEADVFAAQLLLPDDKITDYIYPEYDIEKIVRTMKSDINLVTLRLQF